MEYRLEQHNFDDPDPWVALGLDRSTYFDARAKEALLRGNGSKSRQFLLPVVRPLARLSIILVQLIRIVIPNSFTSSRALHAMIVWGMKHFVSPDANYLIIRHFNIGSQILKFLSDNIAGINIRSHPLHPRTIEDLRDNVFIQHDLNIYNFIIQVNAQLGASGRKIEPLKLADIDFSAIEDVNDRIAIVGLVNNKHPMVPLSTMEAGFRLMLHGLDAENLYGFVKFMRDQQKSAAQPLSG
jgi:hypothetical protein